MCGGWVVRGFSFLKEKIQLWWVKWLLKKLEKRSSSLSMVHSWWGSILLSLQQLSLPSQSVTNSHRPPRSLSLFLLLLFSIITEAWLDVCSLLFLCVSCCSLHERLSACCLSLLPTLLMPLFPNEHTLLLSAEKEETSCHCSPPVAAVLHPAFPGSQHAGAKTRQSDGIPFSCQPTTLTDHTVPTQE